jgi:protein arginine kinase activator
LILNLEGAVMECEKCKKNEAVVHLTQVIGEKVWKIDLCEACAKADGVNDPTGFSLAGLLQNLERRDYPNVG